MLFQGDAKIFFIAGCCLLCLSIFSYAFNKEKLSLIFLSGSALFFFSFAAAYYPFLNVWDERFHALVGKNLMRHPLMPTLYDDPVVQMDYRDNWARYHIWVHKQPLFMWQMALSQTLFGVSEFTMRLPNVFLACALVYAGYRSGTILGNKQVGYFTALLLISSPHLMQLLSGRLELDQNDFSFVAYISLSLWCWLEYLETGKRHWIFLTGLFSGCALLCKWLVGLLVYLCWVPVAVFDNGLRIRKYWDIASAILITALIFLPWQLLILKWYPAEARAALQFNIAHFSEATDGHTGPFFYHIALIPKHFGIWVPYLIIPAFFVFYKKAGHKKAALALITATLFVYVFFTLAATKMPSFTSVAILPIFLSLAFLIDSSTLVFAKLKVPDLLKKISLALGLFFLFFIRLDASSFLNKGVFPGLAEETYYNASLTHNKAVFQKLHLPANAVLFNVKGRHYIEAMYYTGIPAYGFVPTEDQCRDLDRKNRVIALFVPDDGEIPTYLRNNKDLILLQDTIILCE